jgi:L-iditol 2-dehydrogenase
LDLLSSGRINVKPLITHRFGFNQKDVVDAFETSAKGGSAIKVMFNL